MAGLCPSAVNHEPKKRSRVETCSVGEEREGVQDCGCKVSLLVSRIMCCAAYEAARPGAE